MGQLEVLLKMFYGITKTGAHSVTIGCTVEQVSHVVQLFKEEGYVGVRTIFWTQPGAIATKNRVGWLSSVECFVQGYSKKDGWRVYNCPDSVDERKNQITGDRPKELKRYGRGDKCGLVVNPAELPTLIIKKLLRPVMMPGGTVLIVGSGAGGEVRACIEEGWSCVGIELDEDQFKFVSNEVSAYHVMDKKVPEVVEDENGGDQNEEDGEFIQRLDQCGVCGRKEVENIAVCSKCKGVFCLGCVLERVCGICVANSKRGGDEDAGGYVEVIDSGVNSAEIGGDSAEVDGENPGK
jgi:hypothetical protein